MRIPKKGFTTKMQEDGSTLLLMLVDDVEFYRKTFRPADHGGSRGAAANAATEYGNEWLHGTAKA